MAALVLVALSLAACAGTPTKAYTGPVLPAEQAALITSGFHTDIVSVDGIKVSAPERGRAARTTYDNLKTWQRRGKPLRV